MNMQLRLAAQQRIVHSHHPQDTRMEKDLIADISPDGKGAEEDWLHGSLQRKEHLTSKVEEERGKVGKHSTHLLVTILSRISMKENHLSQ